MSRLIFKNLPPAITPESFKAKLAEPKTLAGVVVTDTKVVSNRRFAFVGYKSEDEAKRVKEWFDGSFAFGGGKVKVDLVRDEQLFEKPAKRARTDKGDSRDPSAPEAGPSGSGASSKRLQEFMDVMKGGADASNPSSTAVPGDASWVAEGKGKVAPKPKKQKGKEKAEEAEGDEEEAEDAPEDDDDAAWLANRRKETITEVEEDEDEEDEETGTKVDPEEALILSTGRLFVRNLAFVTTAEDLTSAFERFGPLVDVHMPVSQKTGEPLGTAFILFRNPEDAVSARKTLDKKTFQGRLLHILPGRARPGQESTTDTKGITDGKVLGKAVETRGEVKDKVDEKRKADGARGVNWATLYMNSDAVAASVADRMGVSKADLLNGSDDVSPAVKLALAETHVIAETKAYFEKEGIVLEALQPKVPRSQTVILVKNIPFGTTIQGLQDLFSPHGDLKKLLLPPAGTLGVVEFANAMDAGRAFRALSYRRLGNAVLYLEKGPKGMFKNPDAISTPASKEAEERALLASKVAAAEAEAEAGGALRDQPAETDEVGSTLFLKNLAWATTTERLSSVLSALPGFSFARVQTKVDPKRPGQRLSMGFGFVGFKTKKDAQKALGGLQDFEVDGHALKVTFAQRGTEEDKAADKKSSAKDEMAGKTKTTKLLVKNLPFEATKKDVRTLFSAYGTLKSLRVPRKPTLSASGAASSRGFAFLEFTTHAEAQRAMDALKHTHLLGRHLVTEWANDEDSVDVDALREKVSRDARLGDVGGRKRKLDLTGKGDGMDENDGLEI